MVSLYISAKDTQTENFTGPWASTLIVVSSMTLEMFSSTSIEGSAITE